MRRLTSTRSIPSRHWPSTMARRRREDIAGKKRAGGFMSSPFKFAAHGESGVVMSELFPNLAKHADDLCVVRSMHTDRAQPRTRFAADAIGASPADAAEHGFMVVVRAGQPKTKTCRRTSPSVPGCRSSVRNCGPARFLPGQHQGIEVDTNNTGGRSADHQYSASQARSRRTATAARVAAQAECRTFTTSTR